MVARSSYVVERFIMSTLNIVCEYYLINSNDISSPLQLSIVMDH